MLKTEAEAIRLLFFIIIIVWCAEADAPFIMPDYGVPAGPVGP